MEKPNITTDLAKFLNPGTLTEPFLSNEFVFNKIMTDLQNKQKNGKKSSIPESLNRWIHNNIKFSHDSEFKSKYRFQRSAKEIWESGFATGCSDYAMLFATFARQLDLPTTFLHTAELGWLERLKSGKDFSHHYGHAFCECFYENKWILVDPTSKKIEQNYNPKKIVLSYNVGPGNVYIPYFRDADLSKRQSTQQHNLEMDNLCKNL